jgi:hypothetical protein
MILFHGRKDLGELLAPYLSTGVGHGDVICVLPVEAGKGPQRLTRQVERLAQGHPTLLIKNPNQFLVTDSDPVAGFFELLSEIRRQLKNNTGRWVQMGDWVHLLYENVEPLVKIEHGINDIKGLDSVLCCYRIEGFCTLDLKYVAQLAEAHNRIAFQTSMQERGVRS